MSNVERTSSCFRTEVNCFEESRRFWAEHNEVGTALWSRVCVVVVVQDPPGVSPEGGPALHCHVTVIT